MCKRRNIKKIVSSILILFCFGLLCGCSLGKPKFEMNYKIGNNTGVGYISGVAYSTFSVEGTVTIKNYKTDLIVITADAYGSSGDFIHIFTTVNINGDGVYSFKMESFLPPLIPANAIALLTSLITKSSSVNLIVLLSNKSNSSSFLAFLTIILFPST